MDLAAIVLCVGFAALLLILFLGFFLLYKDYAMDKRLELLIKEKKRLLGVS